MIVASVVFPSPGGPYNTTRDIDASPRFSAAWILIEMFSLTLG